MTDIDEIIVKLDIIINRKYIPEHSDDNHKTFAEALKLILIKLSST